MLALNRSLHIFIIKESSTEWYRLVDKNGKADAANLLREMENVKKAFHDQVPTYPW